MGVLIFVCQEDCLKFGAKMSKSFEEPGWKVTARDSKALQLSAYNRVIQ
jgi:hypothetical protein